MSQLLKDEIIKQIERLGEDQQQQMLDYARSLTMTKPMGVPGETLLRFAGFIPREDVEDMERAIEGGCEQVDLNQW